MTDLNIGPVTIAHQMGIFIDMLINDRFQGGSLFIFNGNSPHGAMALNGNQYLLFCCTLAALVDNALLGFRSAANVFFIKLHNALKQPGVGSCWVHHFTDGMAHAPGR